VDWHIRSFHFEAPKEKTSKCKALAICLFGENHDYHQGALEDDVNFD
jgi:hypothetical protein